MKFSSAMVVIAVLLCYSAAVHAQVTDFNDTDFHSADSIAEHYAAHPLQDLKGLADLLTVPLETEQEKFRAIYKWVCSNIEVDYNLLMLNKRKRAKLQGEKLDAWNRAFNAMVYQTLVSDYKTVCTGYAYLIRELCFHAGLSCEIVNGYARPGGIDPKEAFSVVNHSWNKVRLNGKWYWCDATWSSGIFSISLGRFIKKYNNQYFLTEPSVFFRDHYSPHTMTKRYVPEEE